MKKITQKDGSEGSQRYSLKKRARRILFILWPPLLILLFWLGYRHWAPSNPAAYHVADIKGLKQAQSRQQAFHAEGRLYAKRLYLLTRLWQSVHAGTAFQAELSKFEAILSTPLRRVLDKELETLSKAMRTPPPPTAEIISKLKATNFFSANARAGFWRRLVSGFGSKTTEKKQPSADTRKVVRLLHRDLRLGHLKNFLENTPREKLSSQGRRIVQQVRKLQKLDQALEKIEDTLLSLAPPMSQSS
jgi:hypothetical protein